MQAYKVNSSAITGAFISLIVWLVLAAGLVFALAYRYEFWYIFLSGVVFLCTWTMYGSVYPKEVVMGQRSMVFVMPHGKNVLLNFEDTNMVEGRNNYIFTVRVNNKTQKKYYIQKTSIPRELDQRILDNLGE